MTVAIIGLGYVGLPLALTFVEAGESVLGLDIDTSKVDLLSQGRTYFKHIPSERIQAAVKLGRFKASVEFSEIVACEAVIICVPTPLNRHREPDISYVLQTGESIANWLKPEMLVVLESTTYPGTTEGELRRVLEKGSGLLAGEDFYLAYSPEREDPGNPQSQVKVIPKVVGGYSPRCLERVKALYGRVVETVVPVSSCRVAEATKLTENIFRSVNIALVNELKMVYGAMGIDIWEVIEAAKTKPFGFMPFYPGPGLGGHCIPIDPFYLTWKAREFGQHTRFIELAGEINQQMPAYVVEQVVNALNIEGKAVKNARILLLGLAYKPDVEDDRESPAYRLMELLEQRGAQAFFHDPYIAVIPKTREHAQYAGRQSVPFEPGYDLYLLVTAHSEFRSYNFSDLGAPIVDTRGLLKQYPDKYYRA
ncbi:nucleotide sugar dehydrogenase [Leptolyngbya sp. PCC 6406]|uniref:nucleotide sugar dehydrogenase n=1 Tax=Leptolyngbya sp. PCC 6406 TaxID=1173264 RepID=UPI0002AC6E35|nr:nucleotide sugar dehydrogenase [Leptolyngbya sp. PCC 6406]